MSSPPVAGPNHPRPGENAFLPKEMAGQLLPTLAARLCLEVYDRDWVPDLPYKLWSAVTGETACPKELPAEEIALFRLLASIADGWMRHDPEEGPVFISSRKWLRVYAAWKKAGRTRKTYLWRDTDEWSLAEC